MTRKVLLPRVAMFHGGGSTSKIYQMQCEAIEQQLATRFEFVYFDAPFESSPGKGILPYFSFEEWGPYLNWFTKREDGEEYPDGTAGLYGDEEGIERIVRLIRDFGPGGRWVGCMGFSQGTRVVAGLLMWQQLRRNKGVVVEGNIDLHFGILCMGSGQPMTSTVPESLLEWDEKNPNRIVSRKDELIKIPTLHLHGLKDFSLSQARSQMKSYFDPRTVKCIEIDYHHAMPWHKADILLLVENIIKMPLDK